MSYHIGVTTTVGYNGGLIARRADADDSEEQARYAAQPYISLFTITTKKKKGKFGKFLKGLGKIFSSSDKKYETRYLNR